MQYCYATIVVIASGICYLGGIVLTPLVIGGVLVTPLVDLCSAVDDLHYRSLTKTRRSKRHSIAVFTAR